MFGISYVMLVDHVSYKMKRAKSWAPESISTAVSAEAVQIMDFLYGQPDRTSLLKHPFFHKTV